MIEWFSPESPWPPADAQGRIVVLDLQRVFPAWGHVFRLTRVAGGTCHGETLARRYVARERHWESVDPVGEASRVEAADILQSGGETVRERRERLRALCDTLDELRQIEAQSRANEAAFLAMCRQGEFDLQQLGRPFATVPPSDTNTPPPARPVPRPRR